MVKLLLHIGLHRAASTAIQAWLIDNASQLAGQGCFMAVGQQTGLEGNVLNILTGQTFATIPEADVASIIADDLDSRQQRFRAGILSDENISGMMPNATRPPFLMAERLARVLALMARRHEIVPMVVLREHVTWMISLYRVAQLRGETAGFEAFSRTIAARPDLYSHMLQPIAAAAGPGPAIVTSQAAIAADRGQTLLADIAAALGLNIPPGASLTRKNASRNPLVCTLMQDAARKGVQIDLRALPRLPRLLDDLWRERAGPSAEDRAIAARLLRRAATPEAGGPPLRLVHAEALLEGALSRCEEPVASHALMAELRAFFAVDRDWIRAHHPAAIFEE